MDRGYAIYPEVIGPEECESLLGSLSVTRTPTARAGTRHLMPNASVATVANDRRLTSLAAAFVGPDPVPFSATLFEKNEQANWLITWHQDTALPMAEPFEEAGWGPWSKKAGLHFSHAPAWAPLG